MVHGSHKWLHSVYSKIEEELLLDMPKPLGRITQTSAFFDVNLYHDVVTGCTMTGIVHLVSGGIGME